MIHPKKQVTMSTKVKIIYAWLLIMFVICGIGIWIFTINFLLGFMIVVCDAISLLFGLSMLLKTGDALIVVMICQDCIIVNTVVKA